eukprot:TRINITY_DN49250_c0_g1_i1.p3 TRINITY_DN49250_c0_g1~~TRINITY_DN49250_c0_g1_i1.p3  ORF type:complete len:229 (+),score=7.71 TRINITY_DN49250_c0_g1_i1:1600-2286(+)
MKKYMLTFLAVILGLFVSQDILAQKKKKKGKKSKKTEKADNGKTDKITKKTWKKKKDKMDPMEFKRMYDQYNSLKGENGKLNRQINTLTKQIRENEDELSTRGDEIIKLKSELEKVKSDPSTSIVDNSGTGGDGDDFTKGIVYRVQIGAFKMIELKEFLNDPKLKGVWEEDEDGVKKYTIGNFRDYWKANEFKKYLRKMGVKDAWIVAYENNRRKDIKDVLPEGEGKK